MLHAFCLHLAFTVHQIVKSPWCPPFCVQVSKAFAAYGFFLMEKGVVIRRQEGVMRINCIDCLDRTNVIQVCTSLAGREAGTAWSTAMLLPTRASRKWAQGWCSASIRG